MASFLRVEPPLIVEYVLDSQRILLAVQHSLGDRTSFPVRSVRLIFFWKSPSDHIEHGPPRPADHRSFYHLVGTSRCPCSPRWTAPRRRCSVARKRVAQLAQPLRTRFQGERARTRPL